MALCGYTQKMIEAKTLFLRELQKQAIVRQQQEKYETIEQTLEQEVKEMNVLIPGIIKSPVHKHLDLVGDAFTARAVYASVLERIKNGSSYDEAFDRYIEEISTFGPWVDAVYYKELRPTYGPEKGISLLVQRIKEN